MQWNDWVLYFKDCFKLVLWWYFIYLPLNLICSGILVWYSHQSQSKNIQNLEFKNIFGIGRFSQKKRGQWDVNYTSSKSFIITFFYSLTWQLWELWWILIGWFIKLSLQTSQQIIVIYRRDNFVYHHSECTSIYRPLCYPFRSLSRLSPNLM